MFRVDMLPDFLHVIPVFDNAVLHWVAYVEQASVLLGLRAQEEVGLKAAGHHPRMLRSADAIQFNRLLISFNLIELMKEMFTN